MNAYVCSRLWSAGYIDQMGSVEGSYIAISRYVMRHWGDLSWFPLWFCGMPFVRAYQPGLHVTVAALATAFDLTPVRAYHLAAAFFYCLGPATLFWMCDSLTGRRGYAFAVALAYSLFSPSLLLSSFIRARSGFLIAQRYQVLVHYGEGPHIAALALLPLVVCGLHCAIAESRRIFIPVSAVLIGALVATNWTGTVGVILALMAYFASRVGEIRAQGWINAFGIAAVAYLLICPWVPPSVMAGALTNAQDSDGTHIGGVQLAALLAFLGLLAGLHLIFEKQKVDRNLRFFVYFVISTGCVVLGKLWGNVSLVPQPHRFHLELEMAVILLAVYQLTVAWKRFSKTLQWIALAAVAAFCLFQIRGYHRYASSLTRSIEIESTIEFRMAHWFEDHLDGRRVFAPGSVAVWMNSFVDTPQLAGCCDQNVPSFEQRLAFFTVYSDMNAGSRAAEISQLWLKAYGVGAIGMTGPQSREFYKPYAHPHKFDGVLPELWRDGDDVVYGLPERSPSIAHVINASQEVIQAPVNGLAVDPLRPYVAALDDPGLPLADAHWINSHQLQISTVMTPQQVVSVQMSYAPGWEIRANQRLVRAHADALGLMVIKPGCAGPCSIDLIYDGGPEARWTRVAQWIGVLACIAWPLTQKRARSSTEIFPPHNTSTT
ncbi:MAG: hypothetical protein ABSB35_06270 [Bryobacteraceae bacterium]